MKRRQHVARTRAAHGKDPNPLWIINVAMAAFFIAAALLLALG